MASCEVCGDDLRRVCSQGHASRAGTLFCETCGEMLPLAVGEPAMADAAPLTMDYSTGSFADFIAGGEDAPFPGLPRSAAALADAPSPAPAAPAEPIPGPELTSGPEPEPTPEPELTAGPELVTGSEADLAPAPVASPAPDAAKPAPEPVPPAPPASKATVTAPKPAPPAPKADLPTVAPPKVTQVPVALPTLAPPATAPQAANGGPAVTTTMPPDLRFTIPRDHPRTWRSSTKPRDAPGPDGGVHHDDGPPPAGEPGPPAEPLPGRSRRFRVIAIVATAAVLAAGG